MMKALTIDAAHIYSATTVLKYICSTVLTVLALSGSRLSGNRWTAAEEDVRTVLPAGWAEAVPGASTRITSTA